MPDSSKWSNFAYHVLQTTSMYDKRIITTVRLERSFVVPGVFEVDAVMTGVLSQTPRDTSMTSPCDCRFLRNMTASSISDRLTKLRL